MNKEIVVTYFEPFGGRTTNTSKEVAGQLSSYFSIELPVSWEKAGKTLLENLPKETKYLFLLGEAGSYQDVTVELVARNISDGVDNYGVKKEEKKIDDGNNLTSSIVFNKKELPVNYSYSAGKYLCNFIYYFSLKNIKGTKIVFIHLPYPRDNLSISDMKEKVEEIISYVTSNKYKIEVNDYQHISKAFKDIRKEVFIKEQGFEYEFDSIDYEATHFLLSVDNQPVGTCRLFFDKELNAYHLGRVAVKKEYRHLGIGSMLLLEVEKYLCQIGVSSVILGSQLTVTIFYKKNGYLEYGDIYLDEGVEHIHMKKKICG